MEVSGSSGSSLSSSSSDGSSEGSSSDWLTEVDGVTGSFFPPLSFAALTAKATPAPIAISASRTKSHILPRPPPDRRPPPPS